ncbi:phosphorothioated DNA-binding restriction endonuclease [Nocardiopsis valliformis]|uniref:phosphorothioated DNA-binding restriction endonuclease n=1 Tax=Nocardiopsis valliformis TaxID=239974 RepID=UPI00034A7873|nr:HNH endonuclease [Nocardiopsis valliformis]
MDWIDRIASVRRWGRNGYRAPHKPLLLLYALGDHQRHGARQIPYSEAEQRLSVLLEEFGPPRRTSPAYPFHHLTSDGFWCVDTVAGEGSPGASPGLLRRSQARGSLVPELAEALDREPGLLERLAHFLLESNFEPSLHTEISTLAGLTLAGTPLSTRDERLGARRDPGFRDEILVAYEYQCAFCGYDGWIDGFSVGLEAAHVRWWALGGPDEVDNGLCLCSIHHRLFDRGVLGLSEDLGIVVSTRFVGRSPAAEGMVLDLSGRPAGKPQAGLSTIGREYVAWHTREVFRGRARTGVEAGTST